MIIVAGKGGVGKTTVSAAMARAAALVGMTSLIVEVEGKSGLAALFGSEPLGYEEVAFDDHVRARTLTPDEALTEYLEDHGFSRISRRLAASGALDVVATAAPGIKDILILGKVRQMENAGVADLILLDAPAAGHAISFLRSPKGLLDAVSVGPVNTQAREALEMLGDPSRCQVVLVTLPEETPVNELVETAFKLEDEVGVQLGPVVVNGLYPPVPGLSTDPVTAAEEAGAALHPGEADALRSAAEFRRHRTELQTAQVERLATMLPLPQLHLPHIFDTDLGPEHLDVLAASLLAGIAQLDEALT